MWWLWLLNMSKEAEIVFLPAKNTKQQNEQLKTREIFFSSAAVVVVIECSSCGCHHCQMQQLQLCIEVGRNSLPPCKKLKTREIFFSSAVVVVMVECGSCSCRHHQMQWLWLLNMLKEAEIVFLPAKKKTK